MTRPDETLLRRAFALARAALERGDMPFGAIVATADGKVLSEAGSTQASQRDATAHAVMNALRRAMTSASRTEIAQSTLYASAEPCVMCTAALFYAGIGRIVFGVSQDSLRSAGTQASRTAGLPLSCRVILARPSRQVEVVGPLLEDEALRLFERSCS